MADFYSIHSSIWEDEKFRTLSSSRTRLLFIFLFSYHRCPVSGIYKISIETMAFMMRITVEECKESLDELISARLVSYDSERNAVWVHGKIKHDKSWTAAMRKKSIKRSIAEFSKCSFMQRFYDRYPQLNDLAIQAEKEEKELQGARAEVPESPLEAEKASETGELGEGLDGMAGGSG